MSDNEKHDDQTQKNDEFESLIPEFPYVNPVFEKYMNTPVRQRPSEGDVPEVEWTQEEEDEFIRKFLEGFEEE